MGSFSNIKEYIDLNIGFLEENYNNEDEKGYKSIYHFLKKEGSEFNIVDIKYTEEGIIKECFKNSLDLCFTNQEKYIYTEGYTITFGLPILHAWITTTDGKIIDPTIRKHEKVGSEYFGVQFDFNYVIETTNEKKTYGILDNYQMGFPILTGEHKKEDWKYKKD